MSATLRERIALIFTPQDLREPIKQRIQQRTGAAARAAIAKVFNDTYTYREHWPAGKPVPGESWWSHHAWMCPECNRVHVACGFNSLHGLLYPACCSTAEGGRVFAGIRTR
jgi:hypothetical protein